MNHVATVYNSAAHRMECELCTEQFDLQARRPKVTPCGHTACMACLSHLQEKRCPSCRKALTKSAAQLPDNFKLLDLMREEHDWNSSRRCFWCLACKEVAKEGCMDDHPVRRIKAAVRQRMKQLRDLLPQLTKDTQDMLEALANDEREGEILAAMKLLDGPDTFCSLVLHSKGDSKSLAANWELAEGPPTLKDPQRDKLLRMLVLLLVKTGDLKEESMPLIVMDSSRNLSKVDGTVGEGKKVLPSATTDQKTSQSTGCESEVPVHKSASDQKTIVFHPSANEKFRIVQSSAKDEKTVAQKPATGETVTTISLVQPHADHKYAIAGYTVSGKTLLTRQLNPESEKITAQHPASNVIVLPISSESLKNADQQPPSTVVVQPSGPPAQSKDSAGRGNMKMVMVTGGKVVPKAPNAMPTDNTVYIPVGREVVRAQPAPPAPPADPIPYLDVYYLSNECQGEKTAKLKADLLERVGHCMVWQLNNVMCRDPAWTRALLEAAGPHLRKLKVCGAGRKTLAVLHAMPRLQRLHVVGCSDLNLDPPVLPPLHTATLTWLRVKTLPRETVLSILKAHAATLRGVVLEVGVTGSKWWPENCNDLHVALSACRLRALQILVLERPCSMAACIVERDRKLCDAQLKAVGRCLRGVEVVCLKCYDIEQVHLEV